MRKYERFRSPHIVFGDNSLDVLGAKLAAVDAKKCLIITDEGIVKLGFADKAKKLIEDAGIECDIYDKCLPDPPDYICIEASKEIKNGGYDSVVGFGGGSSMDTAKVASLLAGIPEEIEDLHEYGAATPGSKMKASYKRPVYLITVPTTSGTAAETTITGVISSTQHDVKFSIGNENMIADMAIVDPMLTVGMPPRPTVNCGIDILAHAIETVVGTQQSDYTNLLMLDCIDKAWKWLPIAVKEPQNVEARGQLSYAAHNALAHAGVPNGHAVAHAIGALYHLVHGHACAIVLPTVVRWMAQSDEAQDSIQKIANIIGVPGTGDKIADGNHVADAILKYYKDLGLTTLQETLKEKGINEDKDSFIEKAIPMTLDDGKSKQWMPPIHEDMDQLRKVLGMIYDEQ